MPTEQDLWSKDVKYRLAAIAAGMPFEIALDPDIQVGAWLRGELIDLAKVKTPLGIKACEVVASIEWGASLSFLYPRTISLNRPNSNPAVGALPYQGLVETDETQIATNISCSIQERSTRGAPEPHIPADNYSKTGWYVFVPIQVPQGRDRTFFRKRDVIIDDNGIRYVVTAAYWDSLGWKMTCDILEA